MPRSVAAANVAPAVAKCQPNPWDGYRAGLLERLRPAAVCEMRIDELEAVQLAPGVRLGDTPIVLPPLWFAPGSSRKLSNRTVSVPTMATGSNPVGSPGY